VRIGVNKTSLSFAPEGGTLEFGVSANVTWKATTKETSWLTVTTKNDVVTVKAKANSTEAERKGIVSVTYTDPSTKAPTSIDVEVVQSAYRVTFATGEVTLTSDQSSATVKFTASDEWTASVGFAGGAWLEQISSPWATISSTSGAAGEQTLTVNFVGNDYKDRSVSVLVKCGTLSKALTITQKAVPAPQVGRKVRFMTLNQKIRGNEAIAKMITDLDIDYVAVQEIDMFTDRNNFNQLDSLKKYTGYAGYFCKTIDFGGGQYGIGILSKKEALNTRFVNLTGPESRKLLIAEYDDFVIASTHYTITSSESSMCKYHLESAQITVEELSKYPDKPIVLGGDFNTETDKDRAGTFGEIMKMMDLLTDPKVCTYPNVNSDLLIDFLFFKRDERFPFRKTAGGVLDQTETDHRPVWVELELFF
jgi:endonuclease/exonuclease/phosphatase family metal-dependent hydrolase